MKSEIDVVNIGGGNLGSVTRCFTSLGVSWNIVDSNKPPDGKRPIILPGVGAFGAVMQHLHKDGLDKLLLKIANSGTPFLGICIGLQVLFEASDESPGTAGLSLVKGKVVQFTNGKVPQIGWNKINASNNHAWQPGYVYFVNSFYARPQNSADVLYTANYFGEFCAAVKKQNITAFQFHPEKSSLFGRDLLKRWIFDVA